MKKNRSVFAKIFAYTMLLVLLISLAAVFLFSREFLSFYRSEQRRLLAASFEPMLSVIADKGRSQEEIAEFARVFSNNNQSFKFLIRKEDGKVIFSTPNAADLPEDDSGLSLRLRFATVTRNQGVEMENVYIFSGYNLGSGFIDYGGLVRRSLLALAIMLIIAVLGAVLFARKVTKPLEDEIIRERAMEENQRLFFSAASHELKTPIAAARAIVEGMIAGVGDYNDHPKYLRECLNTLDSQARLVSEILEIVKLSGEETEPSLHFFDLADLGNAVLAEYRPLAEIKNLLIHGEFPHVSVRCDRGLLQRVLSNVIANAVQYTEEGETIRITSNGQKSLCISILNTGAHISEEVVSRLFEPFYRLDTARTRHGTQSGMGLAIVKKALDRMKLPFALENTEEGVLFWVDLMVDKR
jgi:two-component system sensor histidine kinase VanS